MKAIAVALASLALVGCGGAGDESVPAQAAVENLAQSCDSRIWGPLAVRRVVGVAYEIQRGSRWIPLR